MEDTRKALDIRVYGLVQGVGFRPFLHKSAVESRVSGWANNTNDSVRIHAEGTGEALDRFVRRIRFQAPPLARVEKIESSVVPAVGHVDFEIRESLSDSDDVTRVSPDIAVCDDCLSDMTRQKNRIDYPFINCTNCGPRFSIIKALPYDRPKTTMAEFTMCESCRSEYEDIGNRRYHAQPNACAECGPAYMLIVSGDAITAVDDVLQKTAALIDGGSIVAVKGIGGFHLACDATNRKTVKLLRERKKRFGKPLAVMCRDVATVREYGSLGGVEEEALTSPYRPIVLLSAGDGTPDRPLAPEVCGGLDTIGVMLPYTPLHHLLFRHLQTPALVLTSGNVSDEPIAIDNQEALHRLSGIADAFLITDRDIHNRNDDSVLFVVNSLPRFIRRSRGWVPDPVRLPFDAEGIAACGAELKGSFCLGKGETAVLSQHLGDLKNPATYEFYREAFERFCSLFRFVPERAVCDLHPDYLSTRFAEELGVPLTRVQHHHAHIASGMVEHGESRQVIGVAMDGTGYGDDGAIWGGEFLISDLLSYRRAAHLEYQPLPGGDAAVLEPWRMAVSLLYARYGREVVDLRLPVLSCCKPSELDLLLAAIDRGVNSPPTSSAGRLFDAVAALIGVVTHASFDAEGPMKMEALITPTEDAYPYTAGPSISLLPAISEIVSDIRSRVPPGLISAKFHNTFVNIICETVRGLGKETGIQTVVLSGGTFQNRYLLARSENRLRSDGFMVLSQTKTPSNDGGISLGQLAVAAAKLGSAGY